MAVISLATLNAPELNYLSKSELADWLVRQQWEIDVMVKAGVILDGKVRPGKKFKTWSKDDAAVIRYVLDNLERVAGADQRIKESMPSKREREEK